MRAIVMAAVLGVALTAPVQAAERDDAYDELAAALVRGLVQERDVAAAFDYLHEALDAAAAGRKPPPADHLERRAGEIGAEVRRRGVVVGHVFIHALEQAVRQIFAESQTRPDATPPPAGYH